MGLRNTFRVKDASMPLRVPSSLNRKQHEKILYRASKVSIDEIEARAASIANEWTLEQRAERKCLGTAKSDWLFKSLSENHQPLRR
jgi:hypothetical protein